MGMICAVTFTKHGRLYYLDPGGHSPRVGDMVLVPTDDGPEVAQCVWAPQSAAEDVGGLPVCAGIATTADLARDERNRRRRAEVRVTARRLVRSHQLPMKITAVDVIDRGRTPRVVVYFTAPHRVDFRALVSDLAHTLDTKVELRQLSARDDARVQGGIGPCGRDTCCSTFLKDFEPVSIRMAKDQELPVNPLRISGACGRLLCCLKYEHPLYTDFTADAPAIGATVDTPDGAAEVLGYQVPAGQVLVRLRETGRRCACSKADVCRPRLDHDAAYPPAPAGTPGDLA